jgi:hypothetical protein
MFGAWGITNNAIAAKTIKAVVILKRDHEHVIEARTPSC